MPYKTNGTPPKASPVRVLNDNHYMPVDGLGTLRPGRYALQYMGQTSSGTLFYTVPPAGAYIESLTGFSGKKGDVFQAEIALPPEGYVALRNKQGEFALALERDRQPVTEWMGDIAQLLKANTDKPLAMPVLVELRKDGEVVYRRPGV